ncbi:MAG: LysR family transcriptional regulator [Anaerolineales bacterium]|nr:LysR family transcriptional regulator [Anaerolineales bacterium]
MLDVHQLNVFLAAAETLNFTQAAQRLHMTQPSVSQHIQGLERHFDMQLFLRNGRNLELTEAGIALLPLAREAVSLSIRIDEMMESLKGKIYGHLIVGCSTTPGKYILPQLLARFHRIYPQVRVTCQVAPQTETLRSVAEGEAHFALYSITNESYPDIEAVSFLCDPIVLIAPLDHPWAKRETIEPSELLEGDFIMRETSSGTFSAVREALAQHNISTADLRILITLGNAEAIALAVQEGIGVGFLSQMVVDRLCHDKVAIVRVRGVEICREIFIGRNNRRPATRAQTAFWDFLTHNGKRLPDMTNAV